MGAGSRTSLADERVMIKEYCELCNIKTGFGYFYLGMDTVSVVRGLREREGREKSGNNGAAYSCWQNVTATNESEPARRFQGGMYSEPYRSINLDEDDMPCRLR